MKTCDGATIKELAATYICLNEGWLWLAVKQWASPKIDPHTANDMKINYAQGIRQAELATVDGAEKSRLEGGGSINGQHSQCHQGIVS